MERFASLLGLFVMVSLAWLMSSHRGRVRWRLVAVGVLLQFVLAALIFHTPAGKALFEGIQYVFVKVIACADNGSKILFGKTVDERDALVECGCDWMQGYLFGRPDRAPVEPDLADD